MENKIKTRNGNYVVKNEGQSKALEYLYRTWSGNLLLKALTRPIVSKIAGAFCDSPLSAFMIVPFIKKSGIDMREYHFGWFRSYNEFFTRQIRSEYRPVDMSPEILISPCDSKLSAYKIGENSRFEIKGGSYTVKSMLKCGKLAQQYKNGWCLIFRLEVDDYHRYIYFDSGKKSDNTHIDGVLHTVNPIALEKADFYKENSREFCILHTENFGDAVQIEVGAMLVGRIKNHHQSRSVKRGQEKGMFEFGGSTIVLLLKDAVAEIDEDILKNSSEGIETVVKMGEKIGRKA